MSDDLTGPDPEGPDHEGPDHDELGDEGGVPAELVELYEVLEWENGVADAEGAELPYPDIGVPPPNDPGEPGSTPLVSRAGWGASPAVCVSHNVQPEGTTLHYGGPSPWGTTADRSSAARFAATTDHARCPTIMRAYQRFHLITRGWCDFAYNSGHCPHGVRFEGRGPGVRCGAQNSEGNRRSYASCYLAGAGDPSTDGAKLAALDEGVRLARLRWGHRDWMNTNCPGDPTYDWKKAGFPRPGGAAPAPTPDPVPTRPTLRVGSRGSAVRLWQTILAGAGLLPSTGVDGIFGPKTEAATKRFQTILKVAADGIVGPITWAATDRLLRYISALAKAKPPFPGTVRRGDRGTAVRTWQHQFNHKGYRLAEDGIFGPATHHVVVQWQSRHGLAVDGIAGPKTWATLT